MVREISGKFLFVIVCCAGASVTNADNSINSKSLNVQKDNFINGWNDGINENIDTYSGNLKILHSDINISSNGNNNLIVNRIYDLNKLSVRLTDFYKPSFEWTSLGIGWSLKVAPRLYSSDKYIITASESNGEMSWRVSYDDSLFKLLCQNKLPRIDHFLTLEDEYGNTQKLYSVGNKTAVTSDAKWRVQCISDNIILNSANGYTYDFGSVDTNQVVGSISATGLSQPPNPSTPPFPSVTTHYMDPLKRIDTNGNWLKYEYRLFGQKIQEWTQVQSGPNMNGNYVEYPYRHTASDTHESPSQQIQKIISSDGVSISFVYNSGTGRLETILDNNGRQWSYNYKNIPYYNTVRGSRVEKNLVNVVMPDQQTWSYDYYPNIDGIYHQELSWGIGSSIITSMKPLTDQTVSIGKLKSMISPNGGKTSYEYSFHNLFNLGYENNETYFRDARGEKLSKKVLSSGETWSYSYRRGMSDKYDSTVVTGPDGITTYNYLGFSYYVDKPDNLKNDNGWKVGQLIEKIDPLGNLEKFDWIPHEINGYSMRYDEYGRIRDSKTWKSNLSKKTIIRDGGTYTTEYQNYDVYGNPGKVIETGPNGENRTTNFSYYNDPTKWIIGKPKDEATYNGSNLVGSVTRSYDDKGQLLSENKDGVVGVNTYDAQGNIATKINANGATTTLSNYKRGIAQTEIQPEGVVVTRVVDNAGNVSSETNGAGHKTSYTYDGLNRVTSITPPAGDKTTISYTATSQTAVRGDLVEITNYDGFGRPKETNKGGIKTTYNYDAFNNKIFESYPDSSNGTAISYDALNRIKTITNPDNTKKTYNYGKASASIIDERGKTTAYNYRSYGNPDEQHLMSIIAAEPSANVTLGRNGRDQVTGVTQGGLTRVYGYNNKYQLTSVNNPETGITTFGRDNVGNVTSQKVGASAETTLSYDNRNRNTLITYSDGTPSVTKSYTKLDQLDTVSNNLTTRKFNYDANNNLTNEALTVGGINFTTTYQYNSKDHLQSIIYPQSGTVLEYAPDILGRPTKVGDYVTGINYWPSGQFKQLTYGNGTVTNYGQNTRLWPSQFETVKENQKYLNSSYGYDGVGNLLTITDSVDNSLNRTASYDGINRLSTVQGPWGTGTINYDGVGNITQQSYGSQNLSYNYDGQNRLNSTAGIKTGTYGYDALGNVINDGQNQYHYNALPSLTCINCNDATKKIEYGYDGLNKRVSVKKEGVTRYEVLSSNGDQLIEYSPDDNKLIEYFYLGGKRIAQKAPPVNMIDSILPAILSLLLDDDE